jgi:two-component system, chemotaxis family, sensor kinase CheA
VSNDPEFRRRLRALFEAEASEHLRAIRSDAFALERTGTAAEHQELVERIFRETHTLKGAARMVGEVDAESLCHSLEQRLSGLKQAGRQVPPPTIADLHEEIAEIARTLRLPVEAMPPPQEQGTDGSASAPPAPPAPAAPVAASVRVPGARLDALLMRAEEMVGAKLTGDQHAASLRALSNRGAGWRKELERVRSDLAALRRFVDSGEASPVAKELGAVLHYLDWSHEFLRELHGDVARLAKVVGADQRRLGSMIEHLLDETKEILMQPFSALLEIFPAFVRDIARQQEKEIELVIDGAETEIDRRVLEELRDALLHLVRNSIDHGIEPAEERRRRDKPERGRLAIAIEGRSGGNVEITVADDGRGIDPAQVTASARRRGLLPAGAPDLSDEDAIALLFRSGFSTRDVATDLSGRGLGLAIVREKAEQIGGTVSVENAPGRGMTFRVLVPLTLARFRGLFIAAQTQMFVIPAPFVRRVLRLRDTDVRRIKDQEVIEHDGAPVVVLRLGDVLGLPAATTKKRPEVERAFVVLLESGRSRVALRVDQVPYEQEIVMKNLGRMLRGARQYVGATITGGDRIVPVLNVSHLLGASARGAGAERPAGRTPPGPVERRKRTVLVVEDSITSRSLLKSILQAAGYEVRTAVDGADAMTVLKFEPIDLVISDVQMPRMDGFELTAKIRADKELSTLPVVLITSLASREDRERGGDAGANAYIVKSSFDQSDLLEAMGRLIP